MMSSDREGGVEEETREAKIEEDDRTEGIHGSAVKETERLALGECSVMDKVMNEKIHLAEKRGRVMGRSLLKGEPKNRKNEDSEKSVRRQTSRSE